MNRLDVSVVIPNYNRTESLFKALNSIAGQTRVPSEVIIIDDCSSPENLADIKLIVEAFHSQLNTSLLVNERNQGANFSRNRGISSARSKYIAFLDSDDLWMPKKLELQMAQIEATEIQSSKPILSATGRYRVDGVGKLIARQSVGLQLTSENISRSNFIGTLSSVIIDAAAAKQVGGFDCRLPACQDWDFFIRLVDHVEYVGIDTPLCIYVDHSEERITLNNRKRLKAHIQIYKKHIRNNPSTTNKIKAEIFKKIAEELQVLNRKKQSSFFYSKYKINNSRSFIAIFIPDLYWHAFYRIVNIPDLKALRYNNYKKRLNRTAQGNRHYDALDFDLQLINEMMAKHYHPNSRQRS